MTKQPIDVAVEIQLPPEQVWDYVKDINSHTEWMKDAAAIRITSESTTGAGTTFECDTKIGPFKLVDKMEITEWTDNKVMGVRHEGIVSGWGKFSLTPAGDQATTFRWAESLNFLGIWVLASVRSAPGQCCGGSGPAISPSSKRNSRGGDSSYANQFFFNVII